MFTKKLIDFVGKWNKTKLTCFNFVVGKGLTLVTLVGRTLFENYVEMVAGLPINEQINDQDLLRLINRVS